MDERSYKWCVDKNSYFKDSRSCFNVLNIKRYEFKLWNGKVAEKVGKIKVSWRFGLTPDNSLFIQDAVWETEVRSPADGDFSGSCIDRKSGDGLETPDDIEPKKGKVRKF